MNVYDLDGTLSSVNNTFYFIKSYHVYRGAKMRLFFCEFIRRVMNRLPLPDNFKRLTLIHLYFCWIKAEDLENFFENVYKEEFLSSLTELGQEVLSQNNLTSIMLTGCTEIPARQINSFFGFGDCVCTEFRYCSGRICGVGRDTYGNKKIKYIKSLLIEKGVEIEEVEYYTDDVKSEDKLVKIFKKTHVV